MENIILEFNKKLDDFLSLYEKKALTTIKKPILKFDLKGHCAGMAIGSKNTIRLNIDLIKNPLYYNEMITDTLGHELAHIIVHQRYRKIGYKVYPHGYEWEKTMKELLLNPEVTHSMKTKPARKTRRWEYNCSCQTHTITTIKHNKIQKGDNYVCRTCKTRLVWSGNEAA